MLPAPGRRRHLPLAPDLRPGGGGLGVPGCVGDYHGRGQLHHGHRHSHVWSRPALAGGGPGGEHLPPVPGLGQSPCAADPLQVSQEKTLTLCLCTFRLYTMLTLYYF